MPISTCPLPDPKVYAEAGRFGAHNIHENVPLPTAWQSDQIVLGTFFDGGLRAYDISNAYQPKEVGVFMPPAPPGAPTGTIQMNDVFVDERQIVYAPADLRRRGHAQPVRRAEVHAEELRGPALQLRDGDRRLRRRPQLRHLLAPADLRRRQPADGERLRRHHRDLTRRRAGA